MTSNQTSPRVRSAPKDGPKQPRSKQVHASGAVEKDAASAHLISAEKMVIVKPVVNAVRILRYLGELGSPARAITIARALGLNASTCFNILRTLVLEDLVTLEPLSKTYTPGAGLTRLVENFLSEGQRVAAAIPHMAELAAKHSVTLALWKRVSPDRIILVKTVSSPTNVRIEMAEGQRLPMLMGATGRLFAPTLNLSRAKLESLFKTLRWQRPLTFAEYCAQVEEAQRTGWAIDDGYFGEGIKSLAVPITDRTDAIPYTLVAIMFRNQLDAEALDNLGTKMKQVSARLAPILF